MLDFNVRFFKYFFIYHKMSQCVQEMSLRAQKSQRAQEISQRVQEISQRVQEIHGVFKKNVLQKLSGNQITRIE